MCRITDESIDTFGEAFEMHNGSGGISGSEYRELLYSFVWKTMGLTCYLREVELSKILTHYVSKKNKQTILIIIFLKQTTDV